MFLFSGILSGGGTYSPAFRDPHSHMEGKTSL